MSSTKAPSSKLDELESHKAARNTAFKVPKPVASTPPVITIKLDYTDHDGAESTISLPCRVLTRDDVLDVHRLAAFYSGIEFDLLGREAQDICLARATVETLWSKEMPEWLKTAMEQDETIALKLYRAVNSHRDAYFRGDYREGQEGKKAPGLVVSPILPPHIKAK